MKNQFRPKDEKGLCQWVDDLFVFVIIILDTEDKGLGVYCVEERGIYVLKRNFGMEVLLTFGISWVYVQSSDLKIDLFLASIDCRFAWQ